MLGIGFYSLSDNIFCNFGELKGVITQKIKKFVFLSKCVPKHVFSFYFILWGCSMPKYCKFSKKIVENVQILDFSVTCVTQIYPKTA